MNSIVISMGRLIYQDLSGLINLFDLIDAELG